MMASNMPLSSGACEGEGVEAHQGEEHEAEPREDDIQHDRIPSSDYGSHQAKLDRISIPNAMRAYKDSIRRAAS
jgi:hypothetical protein